MLGSGLWYVGMSWPVKQRGHTFTSTFTPLIKIFVATSDFSILHEPLYSGSLTVFLKLFSNIKYSVLTIGDNMY